MKLAQGDAHVSWRTDVNIYFDEPCPLLPSSSTPTSSLETSASLFALRYIASLTLSSVCGGDILVAGNITSAGFIIC
jgi:hypothetical protein